MTPDEPTPDAPSPLHRALRWSLPGAALLSMPVGGRLLHSWPPARATFPSWDGNESLILGGAVCLAVLTFVTSTKAMLCWLSDRGGNGVAFAFVIVFNAAAIAVACVVSISGVGWLVDRGYF